MGDGGTDDGVGVDQGLDVLKGGLDYVLQLGLVGHGGVSFLYLRIFIFINGEQGN
jgi:hypothetical protein